MYRVLSEIITYKLVSAPSMDREKDVYRVLEKSGDR